MVRKDPRAGVFRSAAAAAVRTRAAKSLARGPFRVLTAAAAAGRGPSLVSVADATMARRGGALPGG